MTKVKIKEHEFYLDEFLKRRLDTLKQIVYKKNWDGVILIDGLERVGKSTLGITIGYYLADGNFTVDNICADNEDAVKKIESFPDKSVLLVDEGSLVFNSRDAMKKEQKKLMKILNVVGQKNMIFIIVLPSFFDLNKQIAIRRSKFLLHCYTDNSLSRGRFTYFGEDAKKKLYSVGKKNFDSYQYPKRSINEIGRFTDFNPFGEEYLATKRKSLFSALHEDEVRTKIQVHEKVYTKIIEAMEQSPYSKGLNQVKKAELLGINEKTYGKYRRLLIQGGRLARTRLAEHHINNPLNGNVQELPSNARKFLAVENNDDGDTVKIDDDGDTVNDGTKANT